MAAQLAGTTLRTGEAVLNGGANLFFATGMSGLNAIDGGARAVLATADSGVQFANQAMQRVTRFF